ncbi:MAG: type II toxin-antitoxin system prevent-host-death family antitoxin [Spirochaeta sp.]|jgi:prevent-host-death family protein|nr:type II toxin-antitoxin system prevent-host-death family antitoxin [Spirochaeta sp.]
MKTIGVAELKAHLSRELRRVTAGEFIIVTDHSRAVAVLGPLPTGLTVVRPAAGPLVLPDVSPLILSDPMDHLAAERGER